MRPKPIRAGYSPCCPARCRLDLSSHRDLGPHLTDPQVIEEIVRAIVLKTSMRLQACQEGRMSPQELSEADRKLREWLTVTLMGENGSFRTTEDWNPSGLARYLRETIPEALRQALGRSPENDLETISAAVELLVAEVWSAVRRGGAEAESVPLWWSSLLTGEPDPLP